MADLALDQRALLLDDRRRRAASSAAAPSDRRQRIAQLVPEHRQELVLCARRRPRRPRAPRSALSLARSAPGQMRLDARHQLPRGERLDQVVVGARRRRPSTRASSPARADSMMTGTSRSARSARSSAQQAEAVQLRHHHVGQDEVGRLLRGGGRARPAVGDGLDASARLEEPRARTRACPRCRPRRRMRARRESSVRRGPCPARTAAAARVGQPAQRLLDVGVGAGRGRRERSLGRDAGRRADAPCRSGIEDGERAFPRPSGSRRGPSPPCSCTSSCTSARPMPEPSCVRARAPSTRWKRSNRRGSSCAGIPGAGVAHLELDALAAGTRSVTSISPSSVNLKAFDSRFRTIFSHMSRSTKTGSASVATSTAQREARALDRRPEHAREVAS